MKLPFGKVKEVEIVSRLQFLATKDALEVDEAAIALIAARANGSLHDAELTLDQLSLLDRKVSVAMVQELVSLDFFFKSHTFCDFQVSSFSSCIQAKLMCTPCMRCANSDL
jgi:DNA polymerase III gamma/tau subunit